jgi:RNA polymerase sigma factor (sigma-70 family)
MPNGQQRIVLREVSRLFRAPKSITASDQSLLERFVISRDEEAFAALVRRHGPMVLSICRRWLRNSHDVEDAFQAVFLILVHKAQSIRNRELLTSWLYGMAYRVAHRARKVAQRRAQHQNAGAENVAVNLPSTAELTELRALLDREINALPSRHRLPIILCYVEGLTLDEAAQRLRLTPGAIRGRLARARERLRERLTRRGTVLPIGVVLALLARDLRASALPSHLVEATTTVALTINANSILLATPATNLAKEVSAAMMLAHVRSLVLLGPIIGLTMILVATQSDPMPASVHEIPQHAAQVLRNQPKPPVLAERVAEKPPQRIFHFQVLATNNRPLAGVHVFFAHRGKGYSGLTDREGYFPVLLPARGMDAEQFSASVWYEGYSARWVDFHDGGPWGNISGYTVYLQEGRPASGLVYDDEGKAVTGVKVAVAIEPGNTQPNTRLAAATGMREQELRVWLKEHRRPRATLETVTTDLQGRWRSWSLPAERTDQTDFCIHMTHPDFATEVVGSSQSAYTAKNLCDEASLVIMSKGVMVAGKVTDSHDVPVGKAKVSLCWNTKGVFERDIAETDVQGRYVFPHARLGAQKLVVQSAGFAPEMRAFTATRSFSTERKGTAITTEKLKMSVQPDRPDPLEPNSFELQLKPGRAIKGQVIDQQGHAVANVPVFVESWRGLLALDWQTQTNANGQFCWEHAPEDAVILGAGGKDLENYVRIEIIPEQNDVRIELQTTATRGQGYKIRRNNLFGPSSIPGIPDIWGGRPSTELPASNLPSHLLFRSQ